MHPWRTFLLLAAFAPLAVASGSVYRWVDADGVVHYSDQPQPGAEKMEIGTVQTLSMPVPKVPAGQARPKDEPKKQGNALGYTEVKVISPASGRTFIDEPVPVALDLTPALQQGHTVTWYLNDAQLGQTDTSFTLDRLDRGTYTLYARVTDADGAQTVASQTVTFYVHQPSMLAPQNPRR